MSKVPLKSEKPETRERFTCGICSCNEDHRVFLVPEFQHGTLETFKYFECSHCGCLQIAEIPEDLGRHYPGNYYSLQPLKSGGLKRKIKRFLERRRDRYAFYGKG